MDLGQVENAPQVAISFFFFFFFLNVFLRATPAAYGGSQARCLGVQSELSPLADTTATATRDP